MVTVAEPYATPPKLPAAAVTVTVHTPTSSKLTLPLDDTVQTPADEMDATYVNAKPVAGAIVAARL